MGVDPVSPAGNAHNANWDTGAYQYCTGTGCATVDGQR
jgi:hypothetical protein